MATTQMNIRIDAKTKEQGDAVFAEIGYTPTRVVRLLWEYAACMKSKPDEVEQLLKEAERTMDPAAEDERQRRIRVADEGLRIFPNFLATMGIQDAAPFKEDELSPAERREQAAWERAYEKGLVHE